MKYDVRVRSDEIDITWCANADPVRALVAVEDLLLRDVGGEITITQTAVHEMTADVDVRNPRTWLDADRAREWIRRNLRREAE